MCYMLYTYNTHPSVKHWDEWDPKSWQQRLQLLALFARGGEGI